MKKLIFFILLFLIGFVSSGEIQIDYSQETESGNITFYLEIFNFSEENYDVKIDLFSKEKRISKIWDDGWKSTMYYLNGAISPNTKKEFLINTEGFLGEATVTIKIRDKYNKINVFDNYSIKLIEPKKENKEVEDTETKIDHEENKNEKERKEQNNKDLNLSSFPQKQKETISPRVYETINLNPKTIKTKENFLKLEKNYAKYSIAGFCILLFFLYIIKPRKNKNEFRN